MDWLTLYLLFYYQFALLYRDTCLKCHEYTLWKVHTNSSVHSMNLKVMRWRQINVGGKKNSTLWKTAKSPSAQVATTELFSLNAAWTDRAALPTTKSSASQASLCSTVSELLHWASHSSVAMTLSLHPIQYKPPHFSPYCMEAARRSDTTSLKECAH